MKTAKNTMRAKKAAALAITGTMFAFPFQGCNLGEFQTTSTVTLDGREVVTFLVSSAIIDPIQTFVNDRVDAFFDSIENND